jgi:hypothetical protein
MKYPNTFLIVDLETSGLDPKRHGILEAAFIHPASGEAWSAKVDPRFGDFGTRRSCEFDAAALRVNGLMRLADLETCERLDLRSFMLRLFDWIEATIPTGSIVLVGRNPGFDWGFLEAAADLALDAGAAAIFKARFGHRRLDTHGALLALACARGWDVQIERIDDLYRVLGLEPEAKPHTAAAGAAHCFGGLVRILAEIRGERVEA